MAEIHPVDQVLGDSKAVDANWFTTELGRSEKISNKWERVYHVIDVSLPASAVLNVMRSGSQTVTEALNAGVALAAGCAYRFSIALDPGDTYNLQYTGIAGPQNVTCRIIESRIP